MFVLRLVQYFPPFAHGHPDEDPVTVEVPMSRRVQVGDFPPKTNNTITN
jgi:hypothetical protein